MSLTPKQRSRAARKGWATRRWRKRYRASDDFKRQEMVGRVLKRIYAKPMAKFMGEMATLYDLFRRPE